MNPATLNTLSLKLVRIISTRDPDKVSFWIQQLEQQKNQFFVAHLVARVNKQLMQIDKDLYHWFRDLYTDSYSPEVKQLWLDFVDLCGLSV